MNLIAMLDLTINVVEKDSDDHEVKSLEKEFPITLSGKQLDKINSAKDKNHKRIILQAYFQSPYLDKLLRKEKEYKGCKIGWRTCRVLSFKEADELSDEEIVMMKKDVPKKKGRSKKVS